MMYEQAAEIVDNSGDLETRFSVYILFLLEAVKLRLISSQCLQGRHIRRPTYYVAI
jgi:hypothetical protein